MMQSRFAYYVTVAAAAALLAISLSFNTVDRHDFVGAAIQDYGGRAGGVVIPNPPFWLASRSDYPGGRGSHAEMLEDGVPLPTPHALHADIMEKGGGRFSHWFRSKPRNDYFIFSAADETHPVSNGRTYTIVRPLRVSLVGLLFAGLPLAVVVGLGLRRNRSPLREDFPKAARKFADLVGPERLAAVAASGLGGVRAAELSTRATAIGLAASAAGGALLYFYYAVQGGTLGNAIGAVFQVSDSKDYWLCANQLVDDGAALSWCHRRPLASYFLAGFSMAVGRDLVATLAMQAALIGAATFYFARELARWLGWIAAAVASLIVVAFAQTFALGQTMSESTGLMIGLIAAGVLLRAGERSSVLLACVGVGIFTLGEMVRAGALLSVPFLALWVGLLGKRSLWGFMKRSGAAGAAAAGALTLHSIAVGVSGGDPSVSNANFAQTVYGLSVGGEWSALQSAHPELVPETRENVREIYRLSLGNIRRDPQTFINSMLYNSRIYLHAPWYAGGISRGHFYVVLASIAAAAALSFRSARARLLFFVTAGEFLSALILARDGHPRVWAASGALTQAALPALFVAALARPVMQRLWPQLWVPTSSMAQPPSERPAAPRASAGRLFLAPAGAMVAIMVAPATPLRLLFSDRPAADTLQCAVGAERTEIDFSAANRMRLTTGAAPDWFPLSVDRHRAAPEGAPPNWISENVNALPEGTYVGAVSITPGIGSYVGAYAPPDLTLPQGGRAALCLDPANAQLVANWPFKRILSVKPLR